MDTVENTRNLIIGAAEGRFSQYGFNKTTMAEIAKDCDMSAANLYRFFENKNDILAEMTDRCFRQTEDSLREVLRRPDVSPAESLEAFIVEKLRIKYDMQANQPKFNEIVEYISSERFDLVSRHRDALRSSMAEIIADGNRNGDFDADDIVATAELISKATILFDHPVFMNKFSLDELEEAAKGIVRLLVKGLERR